MCVDQAIILAAGMGTRLKPLTDTMPKALVPIGGKPLLAWQIEKLKAAGIRDIVINVHHFADQIIDYVHDQHDFGCHISFSIEREQLLETGGGIYKAWRESLLDIARPVIALNADILSTIDLSAFIQAYSEEYLSMLVVSDRVTQRYLCFDTDYYLIGWTNIATQEVRPTEFPYSTLCQQKAVKTLAFSGMQILSPSILPYMRDMPSERFSLIDLYLSTLTYASTGSLCSRASIKAYIPTSYRMMDIGKIEHLQDAEEFAKTL